ncbi:MAG: hypothetical protein DRG25_02540 [Deltaproteobacteria bacterium]|nr:MAG: hypothetical protein DRG25_02540 [Deltaproteobacteria bacterium]
MALQGNLETFYLSSLLQLLSNDKKTGVLRVADEGKEVKVYFKEGFIIYAISSEKGNRLGIFLKNKGIIAPEELQKCLLIAKEKKQQLGKVLVEKGYLSMKELKNAIYHQVQNILYDLFLWQKGDFDYKDAKLNLEGLIVTELDTMEIILEASRRVDEMSVLKKQIPNDMLIFKISERLQDKEEIKLNANEWRILSLVNGKRMVREVILESGYDNFVAFKILYSLYVSGLIEKAGEGELEKEQKKVDRIDFLGIINLYNDIFQVIQKNLKEEIGNQAFNIFAECKGNLISSQQELFKNYDLKNSTDKNTEVLLEAVKTFKNPEEGRAFLIIGFNDLLRGTLTKGADILGRQLIQKTHQEIEKILSYVEKYQKDSREQKEIINNIRDVLQKIG